LVHTPKFEENGVDVVVRYDWRLESEPSDSVEDTAQLIEGNEIGRNFPSLAIELKPTMGDDYPSVMRQMARLRSKVLVLGTYTGRGASEPQMRAMFKANGITVIFLQEIEEAMRAAKAAAAEAARQAELAVEAAAVAAYEAEEAAFWKDQF
jgi:hypothetical protein